MNLPEAQRHSVIAQHLRMAQRCNAIAAELHGSGDASTAARQRLLLAVLLHNALMQLPPAGAAEPDRPAWHQRDAGCPSVRRSDPPRGLHCPAEMPAQSGSAPGPADAVPLHWRARMPGAAAFRPPP